MVVKVIVIGDPHIKVNNLREAKLLVERSVEMVKRVKPHFVVCLGDLLDKHETIHEGPFNLAIEFMKQLSELCMTFLIVGNHDYCNNTQFLSTRHPYNALKKWKNFVVVDSVKVYHPEGNDGPEFVFVPYTEPGRFLEALNYYTMWEMADCIFAHQEFYGAKMGSIVSKEGDKWDEDFPLVVSGHIHEYGWLQSNILYTGSAMQHSFGENDDKRIGLCLFDSDNETEPFEYKRINLKLQRKRILYLDSQEFKEFDPNQYEDEKIRLSVQCTPEEYKSITALPTYQKLVNDGVKVVFSGKKILDEKVEQFKKERKNIIGDTKGYSDILFTLVKNEREEVMEVYNELERV